LLDGTRRIAAGERLMGESTSREVVQGMTAGRPRRVKAALIG
jgi:hypothetical protein